MITQRPAPDDGFIPPEVAAAMRANQALADQVRVEARRRLSAAHLAQLDAAVTEERDARIALLRAQQPAQQLIGSVRETALERLDRDEELRQAQERYSQAQASLGRLQRADAAAERDALAQLLAEAERNARQAREAVQRMVGGAWNAQQANAMISANPAIAPLLAAERAADERVAAITQAIQTLYQPGA